MKLNNKGFAISTIMYIILIMAVVIITLTLSLLSNRKLVLDKIKSEVIGNLYKNEYPGDNDDILPQNVCSIVTGSLNTIGSEIDCGGEYFYVISNTANDVTVLSKYNIEVTTTNPKQSTSAGTTYFADVYFYKKEAYYDINNKVVYLNYPKYYDSPQEQCFSQDVSLDVNICLAYWDYELYWPDIGYYDSDDYVYSSNSNLYKYIKAYQEFLKSKGKYINIKEAGVMSKSQYNLLKDYSFIDDTNYWLGTATLYWDTSQDEYIGRYERNLVYRNNKSNKLGAIFCGLGNSGIRPVITISKDSF